MAGTLAFPSFVTGPKDDLAAADVYDLSSAAPINKIQPYTAVDQVQTDKVSALQGGKALLGKIKEGLTVVNAAKALSLKGGDPLQRLTAAQSGLMQLTKSLPPSMSGIATNLTGYVKGLSSVTTQINGVSSKLKYGTDLTKITVLGQMINSVSCDKNVFSVTDRRAQVGAYCGVINMACAAGIPGAYGAALKCESDHGILNQVTASCLPTTIAMSDITSLADMANKVKPGVIKGLNPSALNDFSRTFSLPVGSTSSSMKQTYSTVKDTFTKIEPDWMTKYRGTEQVTDLSCVVGSSRDFQQMMVTSIISDPNASDDDHQMLAALSVGPTDVHQEIQQQLPMLMSINSPASTATIDPATRNAMLATTLDAPAPIVVTSTPPVRTLGRWTPNDQAILDGVNKRYGYNVVKPLQPSRFFAMHEWLAGHISDQERDVINAYPY